MVLASSCTASRTIFVGQAGHGGYRGGDNLTRRGRRGGLGLFESATMAAQVRGLRLCQLIQACAGIPHLHLSCCENIAC